MPLVPEKNRGDNENNQNADPVKTPETEMGEVKAKKEKEKAKDNLMKLASIVKMSLRMCPLKKIVPNICKKWRC